MCSSDIFLGLLALLFPPLAVWVKRGICSADSIINILLCVLGYIPGLIHAWYIIAKFPEPDYDYEILNQDAESSGRVTYVVVHGNHRNSGRGANNASSNGNNRHHITTTSAAGTTSGDSGVQSAAPKIQDNMNYGTASTGTAPSVPAPAAPVAGSSAQGDNAGEGGSDGPPPSYAQVVAGDNKVQSQE